MKPVAKKATPAAIAVLRQATALKPKRNATAMDEFIMDELEEVIMHGALQHLLVLPHALKS